MLLVSGLRIVPLLVVAIRDSDGPFVLLPHLHSTHTKWVME